MMAAGSGSPAKRSTSSIIAWSILRWTARSIAALSAAYRDGSVVVTPSPYTYALLAAKRNLTLLSDPAALEAVGLSADMRLRLAGVPRTVLVTPDNADFLWRSRKDMFFKPFSGHGSKAVYRGDKVTKGVWAEIARGGYVAQAFAAPGHRMIEIDGAPASRKMDVRLYTYDGKMLLSAARLYQGQTTNFRTPGGGLCPGFWCYDMPDLLMLTKNRGSSSIWFALVFGREAPNLATAWQD